MAISVRLDNEFVTHAKIHAKAENRSLPKQIEYWAKIGQLIIDNPELPYGFIQESLLATEEVKQGLVKPYVRRSSHG